MLTDALQIGRVECGADARRQTAHGALLQWWGTRLPQIFGAQLIVEVLFGYPGLGMTLWNAAMNRDFYTMLGAILIGGVLTVVGSLVTDLVYACVDPRIRYVRAREG
ncbi:MAG TPA: ABC transporter permease subunit [Candidatus Acidoferrum sp.]|nr:ABC transporter permease subunit [Candidatus Acidoferrum sp.]